MELNGDQAKHRSSSQRTCSRESISSMKITAGCFTAATANSVRTIFSPSPTWNATNKHTPL